MLCCEALSWYVITVYACVDVLIFASFQGDSLDSAIQAIDALDSRLGSAAESFSVAALKARLACAEQQMAKLVAMDQGRYERWSLVERLGLAQQRLAFLRVKFREVVEIKDPYVLSSYGLQVRPVGAPPVPIHQYVEVPSRQDYPHVAFMKTPMLEEEQAERRGAKRGRS